MKPLKIWQKRFIFCIRIKLKDAYKKSTFFFQFFQGMAIHPCHHTLKPPLYHLNISTSKERHLNVVGIEITLLRIKIDCKLMFNSYVKPLCEKASQLLNAFSRIVCHLDFDQRKYLINAFLTCLVVCMFHSCKLNHYINRIHETTLRVFYKDHKSSFNEIHKKKMTVGFEKKIFKS